MPGRGCRVHLGSKRAGLSFAPRCSASVPDSSAAACPYCATTGHCPRFLRIHMRQSATDRLGGHRVAATHPEWDHVEPNWSVPSTVSRTSFSWLSVPGVAVKMISDCPWSGSEQQLAVEVKAAELGVDEPFGLALPEAHFVALPQLGELVAGRGGFRRGCNAARRVRRKAPKDERSNVLSMAPIVGHPAWLNHDLPFSGCACPSATIARRIQWRHDQVDTRRPSCS